MPATALTKPYTARVLLEWAAPSGSPLKVDRDKRVIYGVRVLGSHSKNSHGCKEAADGTEYTHACMEDAASRLYEGAEVLCNHDLTPTAGKKPRGIEDVLGVLKNARVEESKDGPCVRADLHYYESHPMSGRLVEEAERGIGGMGLSHDARAARERVDRRRRRLVIERLQSVASVDLVRRPATNRSLAESREPTMKTLRQVIEGLTLTPVRDRWRKRLLEDGDMTAAMDAPMDAEPAAGGEGEAAWQGFMAEIQSLGDKFKAGEIDAKTAGKKVAAFFKAHASLFGADEPAEPDAKESEDADVDKGKKKPEDDKYESLERELAALKAEQTGRKLCESLGHATPTELQLKTLAKADTDAERRQLVEGFKAAAKAGKPTSGPPGGGNREPKAPADAKEFARSIKD